MEASIIPVSDISGEVMVPVLSTQRMSERARLSIDFISWRRTLLLARRRAERASATEASRKRPSGIIPMMSAIMAWTLSSKERPFRNSCSATKIMPIGIMAMPARRTKELSERIISDCSPDFMALAFRVSWEA